VFDLCQLSRGRELATTFSRVARQCRGCGNGRVFQSESTRLAPWKVRNLPLFPGIFPDYAAPIVRNSAEGCEMGKTANEAGRSSNSLHISL
jgi:hypothetical protein